MSSTIYYDDLIRDYLLFRGFTATLKAFEAELKADKDKGFRMSGKSSMMMEEQCDWAEGSERHFQEGSDKESEFLDQNDVTMLGAEEVIDGEDNDTHSERSGTANSRSSLAEEQSLDSEESVVVDELDSPLYPPYHNKYSSYEDLDEDAENGEDAKADIDVNGEIVRAILSESQQIRDMLRDFSSSVNVRLKALETSFLAIRNDIKRSFHVEAQDRCSSMAMENIENTVAAKRQKPDPALPLPDSISPKLDPLAQNPDLTTQKQDPASHKLDPPLHNPNPVSVLADSVLSLPETVLPLPDPVSLMPDLVALKPDPVLPLPSLSDLNAATISRLQMDPRVSKPSPVINPQPPAVAKEPAAKGAPADRGTCSNVATTSLDKPNVVPTNSSTSSIMAKTSFHKPKVMQPTLQTPPLGIAAAKTVRHAKKSTGDSLVVCSGKTIPPALDKTKTVPQSVQKAIAKTGEAGRGNPPVNKTTAVSPLTEKQTAAAVKRSAQVENDKRAVTLPWANKRSAEANPKTSSLEERSGVSSPQPGGSGVSASTQNITKILAPPPPKPVFSGRQTLDSKSFAGSGHVGSNADAAKVFDQLLHMQRVQLQNAVRSVQASGRCPNAKLLPIPRYTPSCLSRTWQAQTHQPAPTLIQPAGQQQGMQLSALQTQLAALQAQLKTCPARAMAQRLSAGPLPGPPQRPYPAQMGSVHPQHNMGRTQQQPMPLMGFRLRQSQQVVMGRPVDYSRVLVRQPIGVPNKFNNVHRYRPF